MLREPTPIMSLFYIFNVSIYINRYILNEGGFCLWLRHLVTVLEFEMKSLVTIKVDYQYSDYNHSFGVNATEHE